MKSQHETHAFSPSPRPRLAALVVLFGALAVGCGGGTIVVPDAGPAEDGGLPVEDGGLPFCRPSCDPNATCVADDVCECDAGYEGDGYSCTAVGPSGYCGDGHVDPGEACDGGNGCTDTCTIDPGPSLTSSTPTDHAVEVRIDDAVTLVFSEPVDPASVNASTIRIGPLGWMDGELHDESMGMPGVYEVDGNEVTFRPARRWFQEFETLHHVSVTAGVRDLRGNAAAPSSVTFTTVQVDPAFRYHVHNAQFHDRLDTFAGSYQTYLTSEDTSGSYWSFTPVDGWLRMRNEYGGDDLYLEGSDGTGPALLTGGGDFSGQQWEIVPMDDRGADATANESPYLCHLSTMFQGPARSLGTQYRDGAGRAIVGMEDVGYLDQLWYLENAGPRQTGDFAIAYDARTGHYYGRVTGDFRSWDAARAAAEDLAIGGRRGHLATITSAVEQAFIRDQLGYGYLWIGGYQDTSAPDYAEPMGGWRWVTDEPMTFTNWAAGEPNDEGGREQYLSTNPDGTWNDNVADWSYFPSNQGYLVEF